MYIMARLRARRTSPGKSVGRDVSTPETASQLPRFPFPPRPSRSPPGSVGRRRRPPSAGRRSHARVRQEAAARRGKQEGPVGTRNSGEYGGRGGLRGEGRGGENFDRGGQNQAPCGSFPRHGLHGRRVVPVDDE